MNRLNNIRYHVFNRFNYGSSIRFIHNQYKIDDGYCKNLISSLYTIQGDLPYLVLSGAFTSKNLPKLVGTVTELYLNNEPDEQAKIKFIIRLRETLLRAALVGGFPKVLNSYQEIFKVVPKDLQNQLPKDKIRDITLPIQNFDDIGFKTFERIYKRNAKTITNNINQFSPDFLQFVIFHYGHIMGEEKYINLWENELILIACLSQLNVPTQLKSHLIGAKNVGVSKEIIDNVHSVVSNL